MSKIEVNKIIKNYIKKLKDKKYSFSAIYLFGSYAKGNAHKWSDIDIAVISNKLEKNYEKNRSILSRLRLDVDNRLETHGFTEKDFRNLADPLVYEIRKTGIRII
jgi:predicted nucleotidyltransferase